MKYLKKFDESIVNKTPGQILHYFIKNYSNNNIGKYSVNNDGIIDVIGNVELMAKYLKELPVKFGKVTGVFNCSINDITSLIGSPKIVTNNFHCSSGHPSNEGCPLEVGGGFYCSSNNITSLEFSPKNVNYDFICDTNKITSLVGSPTEINGNFRCTTNELVNLIGSPKIVNYDFDCSNNNITSLEGCPVIGSRFDCSYNNLYDFYGMGKVDGSIYCIGNPVDEIFQLCPKNKFIEYLNEFRPIRGNTILGKRLQECLYMCDINIDITKIEFENYELLE